MKLLFIQGGSRVKLNSMGVRYVDGNFNNEVFEDYAALADDVVFLLRLDDKKYDDDFLEQKFNKLDDKFHIELMPDIYSGIKARFFSNRAKVAKSKIRELVLSSDRVIIRSLVNWYTDTAYQFCKKANKSFLVEVTGFGFESLWNHSLKGKLLAVFRENKIKKQTLSSPYALYVTEKALQKRYPCRGKTEGCSDVRITDYGGFAEDKKYDGTLKIGTVANLDNKTKGQINVLKAMSMLKKRGIRFKYYLVGGGSDSLLRAYCLKHNLTDDVIFVGSMEHAAVFEFLKTLDVYVQPSYQEGLCRAIVEAMSVALPVIASDVGGNPELISENMIYHVSDVKELARKLEFVDAHRDKLREFAEENYKKSLNYNAELLEKKRADFYSDFMLNG